MTSQLIVILAIAVFVLSLLIALYQKKQGFSFWITWFKALIGLAALAGLIAGMLLK